MRPSIILLSALCLPAAALAQSLPDAISFADVIDIAYQANPRAALDRQEIALARADRTTAGAYPNPKASYDGEYQPGEQTNFSSRKAHNVGLEIPLLLGGQRRARIEAAERGIYAAEARVTASNINRAVEAGAAYIGLLVAQEKLAVLHERQKEFGRLQELVKGRQAAGMASEYDLLRIDVEGAAWRTEIGEAKADLAGRQGQLAALLGFEHWRPRGTSKLRPWRVALPKAYDEFLAEHPSLTAARRDETYARANVETARRERFPEVSLNAGRFWTESPYGATTSVGLTVELPLFDTREGGVQKAEAEARSAALRRRLVEAEVEADVIKYAAQMRERSAALANYRTNVEPRLSNLKRMAEDSYKLRGGTVVDLLDATRTRIESKINGLELIGNLMEAELRYQAARGEISALLSDR